MNAHTPVRTPQINRWSECDDRDDGRCPECGEDEMDGARCYYCGFHDYDCELPECTWCNPDQEADRKAAESLARFRAQWPPERCERLGRMMDGDYSQVWAEALAPKETDAPADKAVRGLLTDDELLAHSKDQRKFRRVGL